MPLAGAGFGQSPRLNGLGGLFQRASIITGFAWAHSPVRTSTPANARYRSTTPPGRLSVPQTTRNAACAEVPAALGPGPTRQHCLG
jgi:hypothetical protein